MSKSVPVQWQNRIIGYGEEVPDQLLAHPSNWRIHPKMQQDALSGVLKEVGIVQPVLVNKRTGFVIDGHMRVSIAISSGQKTIPVTYVDLSEDEEAEILSTFDPIATYAIADKEKLQELLHEVSSGEASVQAMLADFAEKSGIVLEEIPQEEEGVSSDSEEEEKMITCPRCGHQFAQEKESA
jgi:hypothetical protein